MERAQGPSISLGSQFAFLPLAEQGNYERDSFVLSDLFA